MFLLIFGVSSVLQAADIRIRLKDEKYTQKDIRVSLAVQSSVRSAIERMSTSAETLAPSLSATPQGP